MNIVAPVDFYNLYAQRHFGASADWRCVEKGNLMAPCKHAAEAGR